MLDQTTLHARNEGYKWYIDNNFSKHMTYNKSKFISFKQVNGGLVKFEDNVSTKISGKDILSLENGKTKIENVLYVEGLRNNILSSSQMRDQGNTLTFHVEGCEIRKVGKRVLEAKRLANNIYVLSEIRDERCMSQEDESWLWHKRMGHIKLDKIVKISHKEVVRDKPKISKPSNIACKQCQLGKKTRVSFNSKKILH